VWDRFGIDSGESIPTENEYVRKIYLHPATVMAALQLL
jgi:hypothetical protein